MFQYTHTNCDGDVLSNTCVLSLTRSPTVAQYVPIGDVPPSRPCTLFSLPTSARRSSQTVSADAPHRATKNTTVANQLQPPPSDVKHKKILNHQPCRIIISATTRNTLNNQPGRNPPGRSRLYTTYFWPKPTWPKPPVQNLLWLEQTLVTKCATESHSLDTCFLSCGGRF